mgnify:CR=1 FL=1
MANKEKSGNGKSFEKSLEELEIIVKGMEEESVDLEECLTKFESGVKLYKECKNLLEKAEKKIQVLTDSLKEEDLD